LFSGGLDSLVGCIDLLSQGRRPILVSHAYPKDRAIQTDLARRITEAPVEHFLENANPRFPVEIVREASSRTRSLLFIALGVVVASASLTAGARNRMTLFIPENGLISLNPPLTLRRIGSLSTRTTHPYFLASIQDLFDRVGISVEITNPYQFRTKGEMLGECQNRELLLGLVDTTMSCGKWKRKNMHCGRCFPCMIRRAAYHAARIPDHTPYRFEEMRRQGHYDDVLALRSAVAKSRTANLRAWLLSSAPFPLEGAPIVDCVEVFRRGIMEIGNFLQ
jgi:hypothetical protein